jgi:uncharacterized protein (TIGR03435 family)
LPHLTNRRTAGKFDRAGNLIVSVVGVLAGSCVVSAPQAIAQKATSAAPKFEVASIRPAAPPTGGRPCSRRSTTDAGHVERACSSLKELLLRDVGILENRLVGPDWMGGQKFDVLAKLPDGATQDQLPEMFQSLLEERFGLAFHHEVKEQPIYALVVAKSGLKVEPAAPEPEQPEWVAAAANSRDSVRSFSAGTWLRSISAPGPDGAPSSIIHTPNMGFVLRLVRRSSTGAATGIIHYEAPSITFAGLAELTVLAGTGNGLDPAVVDMTGLKGRYQLNLDVSLTDLQEMRVRSADQATLQNERLRMVQDGLKKLGLQLEQRKAPVEILVIDHLDRAPTPD